MFPEGQWDAFIAYHEQRQEEKPRLWFWYMTYQYRHKRAYWCLRLLNRLGDEVMARGKSQRTKAVSSSQNNWTTFLEVSLTPDDVVRIGDYASTSEELYDGLEGLIGEGHRVSFSWNPQNDAVICAVTGKGEDCANDGMTMTSFAGDWVTALRVALYKHYEKTLGNWKGAAAQTARPPFG